MFKQFIGGLKAVGKGLKKVDEAKAKYLALDDDTDGDGIPQYQEIKDMLPVLVMQAKRIWAEVLVLFADVMALAKLSWEYILHVKNAQPGDEEAKEEEEKKDD